MIDYVCLGSNDLVRSRAFYEAVLAPLGGRLLSTSDNELGFDTGGAGRATLWVLRPFDGGAATFGNGTLVCLTAPNRAAVDAFHAAALAQGGRDEGAPGPRPHYGPNFYTAYVRDPDGNKLNALARLPE